MEKNRLPWPGPSMAGLVRSLVQMAAWPRPLLRCLAGGNLRHGGEHRQPLGRNHDAVTTASGYWFGRGSLPPGDRNPCWQDRPIPPLWRAARQSECNRVYVGCRGAWRDAIAWPFLSSLSCSLFYSLFLSHVFSVGSQTVGTPSLLALVLRPTIKPPSVHRPESASSSHGGSEFREIIRSERPWDCFVSSYEIRACRGAPTPPPGNCAQDPERQ